MLFVVLALLTPPSVASGSPSSAGVDPKATKMICKKHVETGSFVKSRKVCRTQAQWTRITEFQRDEARDNADRNRGTLNGQ